MVYYCLNLSCITKGFTKYFHGDSLCATKGFPKGTEPSDDWNVYSRCNELTQLEAGLDVYIGADYVQLQQYHYFGLSFLWWHKKTSKQVSNMISALQVSNSLVKGTLAWIYKVQLVTFHLLIISNIKMCYEVIYCVCYLP